jgi:hypothetical protein
VTAAALSSIQTFSRKYAQVVDAIGTHKYLPIRGPLGSHSRADEIQRQLFDLRLEVQTYERQVFEETLASDTIRRIEDGRKAPVLSRTARQRNVPRREIRTAMEPVTECVIERGRPYVCLLDGPAFGSVGYVVGWSEEMKVAAFVQSVVSDTFSRFRYLARRCGLEIPFDLLTPLAKDLLQEREAGAKAVSPVAAQPPQPPSRVSHPPVSSLAVSPSPVPPGPLHSAAVSPFPVPPWTVSSPALSPFPVPLPRARPDSPPDGQPLRPPPGFRRLH